jgi:outer membrane protein assembly factor BamB
MTRTAAALALLSAIAVAHPWPCYHGDPQHAGRSPNLVGDSLHVDWTYPTPAEVSGSPVVRSDGCVLFGCRDVKLYCLTAAGARSWVADLTPYGSNIYFSSPALDDAGNAYITTNRKLVKVSAAGTVLWAWPSWNLSISHSPTIGLDGRVYFACYSDTLYALNPDSTLAWTFGLGGDVNSSPAVGPDGRIYVVTTPTTAPWLLWCISPDGLAVWSRALDAHSDFASPAVGPDTTVYVGAGRFLYAFSPDSTLKWRDSLGATIQSCPAVANESTVCVTAGAYLYNVDSRLGTTRWRRSIGGTNFCSPAVDAAGRVFVGSASGGTSAFYCIAPDSTVLAAINVPDDVWSSPAIGAPGRVYVGCMSGALYAFAGSALAVAEGKCDARRAAPLAWPSPTSGLVHLRGATSATVYDAAGIRRRVAHSPGTLDLGPLGPGVYLVEAATATGTTRTKVVVR